MIFNQKGEKLIYNVRENILFNESSTTVKADTVLNSLNNIAQLVSFELNSSNEIIRLNTVEEVPAIKTKYTITKDGAYMNRLYKKELESFGGDCYMDNNTVMFVIPPDGDEDSYAIKKLGNINNEEQWYLEFFNSDDMLVSDVLFLYPPGGAMDSRAPVIIVDSIATAVNDEGENVDKLKGYQNGNVVAVFAKTGVSLESLKRGDVIQYTKNTKNEITAISQQKILDIANINYGDSGGFNNALQTIVGTVVRKKGRSVILNVGGENINRYDFTITNASLYNEASGNITKSSISEIQKGDIVFVYNSYSLTKEILIIR
jgi:hypothetical protein